LWDYTLLLDQFLGEDESGQQKTVPPALRNDELTDWLITFQSSSAESLEHSLAEWRTKQTVPWLIAAATKMTPGHPQNEQVLKAAAALAPDTPGFASASFHIVRMAIANGRAAQARAKLDELLASHRGAFPRSTVNEFESQRLLLATSLEDFLQHAQKVPAAFSWDDDGREIPAEESEQSEETKALSGKPLFDLDVTRLFNRQFPLTTWKRAAESTSLPTHLRRDVAQAAWLRAVLLDDSRTADALVPTLKSLIPELSDPLNDYAKTTTPDAKKFAALFLWLKTPGLEPIVDSGIGRGGAVGEQDSYRDNWWCGAAFPETSVSGEQPKVAVPPLLNQTEQAAGKTEAARLASFGATPNYLAREVIQWASKHPRDPRVPEALHLVVKTTRFGCTDKETARWSKTAYDLLHRRFPRSIWTKRTPYWFKD
jgi:hypothetical protein